MYRYPDHYAPQNAEELAVFAAVNAAYNGFGDFLQAEAQYPQSVEAVKSRIIAQLQAAAGNAPETPKNAKPKAATTGVL